jgi:myo-inositol-1(or 4)-monophosphatase
MDAFPESEIDLGFLRACLVEAGSLALTHHGPLSEARAGRVAVKADRSPVTEVDRQVEAWLVGQIRARYPGHRILAEEQGGPAAAGETFTWVIDPIDGTRAYASGLPVWGISIGVFRGGEPAAGGLYLPMTRETYWGDAQRAFYNDRPLAPPGPPDLDSPLAFLAVPSDFHQHFQVDYPRVRSLGSTAAHLAYVATGAAVGALVHPFSLWDVAGLLPVLRALGIASALLSGAPFRPPALLEGQPAAEPFLAAHPGVIQALRAGIRRLPTGP